MAEFALGTTYARVPMVSAVLIAKTKLVHFTVKMAEFAPCQTTNVNVVTDITEPDATKST